MPGVALEVALYVAVAAAAATIHVIAAVCCLRSALKRRFSREWAGRPTDKRLRRGSGCARQLSITIFANNWPPCKQLERNRMTHWPPEWLRNRTAFGWSSKFAMKIAKLWPSGALSALRAAN